jgi:hypothetical protein
VPTQELLLACPFLTDLQTVFYCDGVNQKPATHLLQSIHLEVVGGRQQVLYLLRGIFDVVHVNPLYDVLKVSFVRTQNLQGIKEFCEINLLGKFIIFARFSCLNLIFYKTMPKCLDDSFGLKRQFDKNSRNSSTVFNLTRNLCTIEYLNANFCKFVNSRLHKIIKN